MLASADDQESRSLCETGVRLEPVDFRRGGLSLRADLSAYRRLLEIFRKYRPALIQNYHAKPLVLGSFAAHRVLNGSTLVVNTITGLGRSLAGKGIAGYLTELAYRTAFRHAAMTIFQNDDDRSLFVRREWIPKDKTRLVISSGVDLDRFRFIDRRKRGARKPVVAMVGRLLKQKGIQEFVAVARNTWRMGSQARFVIAGEEDSIHPDSISAEWLRAQSEIEYLGHLSNIEQLLNTADVFLYPSCYREGVPRVILEAAATGLSTVAFDVPGVREAVRDGENGYLVSPGNVEALTERLEQLLKNEMLRCRMGRKARQLVEENFSVKSIDEKYLGIYRELGVDID